jgi:APA family basic amino acid/polyamine antiporter
MSNQQSSNVGLKRALGLFDATAISIGAIIGAGIFVVTGIAAGLAGPSFIISIILAGTIASISALSFAQLSAHMPKEGGGYEFTYHLISPFAGFISGWMWVLSNIFTGAAVSIGFAQYLCALVPSLPVNIVAAIVCLTFTLLNYVGVRQSAIINDALVIAKIAILLFFIAFGLSFVKLSNFEPFMPKGVMGTFESAALIFFAYGGYARVTTVSEEVKDPSHTIPKAIILAIILSTILYVLIGLVSVGLVGSVRLEASQSPLTDAISITGSSGAVLLVSLGAMIATASVLLMAILGVSRMTFAMARNGQFPAFLRQINRRFQTPHYAILITGVLSSILVFSDFSRLVAVGTFSLLFHHGLVNLSATRLKLGGRRYPAFVSAIGFLLCISLMALLSQEAWATSLAGILLGVIIYAVMTRQRRHVETSDNNRGLNHELP